MPTANIYGRVSSLKQKQSGAGEAAQDDDCSEHARKLGYDIGGVYLEEEHVSGDTPPALRPKLIEAMATLKKGDILLVAKRDRLGRDPFIVMMIEKELERKKCRLVSAAGEGTADDSGESIFMRRIFDAVSELELFRIRCRSRSAAAAKRRRGERTGQVPYGWESDATGPRNPDTGRLVRLKAVPAEQAALALIEELRSGGMTFARIADELNARGVPPKRGTGNPGGRAWRGRWGPSSVHSVLKLAPLWRAHAENRDQAPAPAGQ